MMAREIPASTSRPSKQTKTFALKKKATKVLARDSEEDTTPSLGGESQVGPVAPQATTPQALVVDLESSATGKAAVAGSSLPDYDGRYLNLPYTIPPNLEVTGEPPWKAHKFHYHTMKPLLLRRWRPSIRTWWTLMLSSLNLPNILLRLRMEPMSSPGELIIWLALTTKRTSVGDILKTTEVLQKEKEIALASAAAQAKVARVEYARKNIRDFLRSWNYATKVGHQCEAYLTHVITHHTMNLLELVSIFVAEHDSWRGGEDVELPGNSEEDVELPGESRAPPA
ncbi:hypothetical protein LIER_30729 [Lithospermum erythrorhizon]|uniref:Uncharacterized protein n=1 Tax=Lithospermum erythrorhizon TaxID=34254 RepID=A0AAV3RQJ6_LITER